MKKFKSVNKETVITGNIQAIIKTYERMGFDCERAKNYRDAHYYFQYADHWKRYNETIDR